MRIDTVTILQLVALNVLSLALLWPRLDAWLRADRCSLHPSRTFTLVSDAVVLPTGTRRAALHVEEGIISRVENLSNGQMPERTTGDLVDVGGHAVMSGFVDVHVHMNEPGREDWEGMWTATRAAAAAGITTVVDMPLNSDPSTITRDLLREKMHRAEGKIHVDVGFWGGLVPDNSNNASVLEGMLLEGALGLKAFLSPSGIGDFGQSSEVDLYHGLSALRPFGRPLLVHAELPDDVSLPKDGQPTSYLTWLHSRPRRWEQEAIRMLIRAAKETGGKVHVCHLSDADALPLLREARESGLSVTVETCPHYLAFASEEIKDGDTKYKCAPPIREGENRERLWQALRSGWLDLVSSDHSPSPPSMKELETGDFLRAWGGISGLQYGPSVTWTQAKKRGHSLEDWNRWWSLEPSKLAGLSDRIGSLSVGKQANLVVLDPNATWTVEIDQIQHRHKITPYVDSVLFGKVVATYVRGMLVYRRGTHSIVPCGKVVRPD